MATNTASENQRELTEKCPPIRHARKDAVPKSYTPGLSDIQPLKDRHERPRFSNYITLPEAVRAAVQSFENEHLRSDAQRKAIWHLQRAATSKVWNSGIIFEIFHDIDTLFFQGKLKGNVYLFWFEIQVRHNSAGITIPSPGFKRHRTSKVTIALSSSVLSLPRTTARDVIYALTHEMLHAYFLVCCGDEGSREEGPDPHHGEWFRYVWSRISRILGQQY